MTAESHIAFAILKPDCVIRGCTPLALETLAGFGFGVTRYRIGQAPLALLWQMYHQEFRWDVDHWEHNLKAYSFGPIVGIALQCVATLPDGDTAQERLSKAKGGTLPTTFGEATLRTTLGAKSRVFNAIHAATNYVSASREALIWVGDPSTNSDIHREDVGISPNQICHDVQCHNYFVARTFDEKETWDALRSRVEHALALKPNITAGTVSLYEQVLAELLSPGPSVARALSLFWGLTKLLDVYVDPLERYIVDTRYRYPGALTPMGPSLTHVTDYDHDAPSD